MPGSHIIRINTPQEARIVLEQIGVDPGAYKYMLPKAVHRCIKLKDINSRQAIIIKQEMLARGGEAAISRNALYGEGVTDVLLIGTLRQFELLVEKLKKQPMGLVKLAEEIDNLLRNMQTRPKIINLANGKTLEIGKKTLIMGILNITPDSFSDGGRYFSKESAAVRAMEMIEQGADIIDIGGASSRPNSIMVDEKEELDRILPVLELIHNLPVPISIDTCRSLVARAALDSGANIINEIGNLKLDPKMADVLLEKNAPVILMHNRLQMNQGQPYTDTVADIIAELQESVGQLSDAGFDRDKVIIDPGIGFGKSPKDNFLIIKQLPAFKSMGYPVLIGLSRKSFIGQALDLGVNERLEGSLGLLAVSIINGASIVRVHDVQASKRVARIVDEVVYGLHNC
jgi:dihydropteroate synthase